MRPAKYRQRGSWGRRKQYVHNDPEIDAGAHILKTLRYILSVMYLLSTLLKGLDVSREKMKM